MPSLEIVNPADHSVVRRLESDTAEQVVEKYQAARAAQHAWAARPLAERITVLLSLIHI